MSQICKGLKRLSIREFSQDLPGLISLIDAQKNLKCVRIYPNRNKKETYKELGKALARKGSTLTELSLAIPTITSTISPSFLTSLIKLKTLSIRNYENYEDTSEAIRYLQKYLAILEFPYLEYLNIYGLSCFKEFAMLIEKTNGNISLIHINPANNAAKNVGMLIKAVANNCPAIKSLTTYLESKDFIHVKSLLLNCRYLEHIRFDRLNFIINEDDNLGDELLDILTKFSPKSLTDITLCED
jgi:hypothetical protein